MTGDGIRRVALTDAIKACEEQRLECYGTEEDTGEDLAYNHAVNHCIEAINELIGKRS